MSKTWKYGCIADIADLSPKVNKSHLNDDTLVSFIPMAAISEYGTVNSIETKRYQEVKSGFSSFENGDILFAKITPCMENGKGALVENLTNGVGFGSTEFFVLRPKNPDSREFVYQLTISKNFREKARAYMKGTSGQQRVSKDVFRDLKIPLPPLSEQKRIASTLSAVDKAIEQAGIAIEESERMKRGLVQMLQSSTNSEWNEYCLGDVVDINPEQRSPSVENRNESIIYVDIDAIENGSGKIIKPKSFIFKDAPSRARRVIHKDDVIVSMVRPENMGFAYVPKEFDNQICSTGFAVLRSIGKTNPIFLLNLMFSETVLNQFRKFTVGGQYPSLTQKTIAKTKIRLPPLLEQDKFANTLLVIDKQIVLRKNRKYLLEILKRGMIQNLLGGL